MTLVNSHVDSRLFKATPDVNHPPFIHATDFCLVDTMLHDMPRSGNRLGLDVGYLDATGLAK